MPKIASKIVPAFTGPVLDANLIEETANAKVLTLEERDTIAAVPGIVTDVAETQTALDAANATISALRKLLIPLNVLSLDGTDETILSINGITTGMLSVPDPE